ncbi:hypothetical protein ABK040_005289 [Willaertia magna]
MNDNNLDQQDKVVTDNRFNSEDNEFNNYGEQEEEEDEEMNAILNSYKEMEILENKIRNINSTTIVNNNTLNNINSTSTEQQTNNNNTEEDNNELKFICDSTIPGIAKHFRMLGVNTLYEPTYTQHYILYLARTQNRIILTFSLKMRDKIEQIKNNYKKKIEKLNSLKLKLKKLEDQSNNNLNNNLNNKLLLFEHEKHRFMETKELILAKIERIELDLEDPELSYPYNYYLLQTKGRYNQLKEVVMKFKIPFIQNKMFTRCANCNGLLTKINDKEEIKELIADNTFEENDHYSQCLDCKKLFWGIHEENENQKEAVEKARTFCMTYSYHEGDEDYLEQFIKENISEE